jgi:hypothetical protein
MNKDKLLKLADFLTNLKPSEFDFSEIVGEFDYDNNCGTVCCAIGWLPVVFPEEAVWVDELSITSTLISNNGAFNTTQSIFEITEEESVGLFEPNAQYKLRDKFNVGVDVFPYLDDDATHIEVADMIRKFVELSD